MASFDEAKLTTTLYGSFATFNPSTGANANADTLPSGSIYQLSDGTILPSGLVSVSNMSTGKYRWSVPIATTGGFAVGNYYEAWITATVTGSGAVTQASPVTAFKVTSNDVDSIALTGVVSANLVQVNGVAATGVSQIDANVVAIATGVVNSVSDGILTRSVTASLGGGAETTATEHTLCTVILACLEFDVAGTGWTIKKTDGSTHVVKGLTTNAAADPIVGVT